jgi:hypothetical protein
MPCIGVIVTNYSNGFTVIERQCAIIGYWDIEVHLGSKNVTAKVTEMFYGTRGYGDIYTLTNRSIEDIDLIKVKVMSLTMGKEP